MKHSPERFAIALILLAASCASCAVRATPPAPAFCATGYLAPPGDYIGAVGIENRAGELVGVFPLAAVDSVCLLRKPDAPPRGPTS